MSLPYFTIYCKVLNLYIVSLFVKYLLCFYAKKTRQREQYEVTFIEA